MKLPLEVSVRLPYSRFMTPFHIPRRDFLRSLGYGVDWHSYPMAHQVCAEEILDLRNWMGAHLASATD